MAKYNVNGLATGIDLSSIDISIGDSFKVVTLDDKSPDLTNLINKIKGILQDTDAQLDQTEDIEVS